MEVRGLPEEKMSRKMLAQVPPMGWNSWNTFYDQYDAILICNMADAMVQSGLAACGYEYLIIDDCWAKRERDAEGNLVPDPEKFPDGLKPVIDYVHAKGMKFGIYSCCGVRTCAGYPGSFEHEAQDAAFFARLGVDYLKYDNCHRPSSQKSEMLYRRMSLALRNSGRDILLAACQWGTEDVERWIRSSGAHTYRSTVDIQDSWESVRSITEKRLAHLRDGGCGCYNDMDMLIVGMNGKGFNPETNTEGAKGCTTEEYQTHFALWAMLNSPLIIGCDIRSMNIEARRILTNKDLIAINQDPEGRTCYRLDCDCSPDAFTLVRPLSGGDYAAAIFNFGQKEVQSGFMFWDMGLSCAAGQSMELYDCLEHKTAGRYSECFSASVPGHGCRVFRCHIV